MGFNLKTTYNNLFGENKKDYSAAARKAYGEYNPFLDKNGNLFNPHIDYQKLIDSPNVKSKTKEYITQATGLVPTVNYTVPETEYKRETVPEKDYVPETETVQNTSPAAKSYSSYAESVGKKIANTASYKDSPYKGECVWYVRNRMNEKLGKDTGAIGNANEMWYNAKQSAKLSATLDNIKPNIIVSYKQGGGSVGQKYGHVIYVEDVVGDTVYYTEGGQGYHKKGTDGVVKTTTKEGLLKGVGSGGSLIGSGVIGFIDTNKY